MKELMMRLVREDEGQDLIEYALLIALIALVVAAALPGLTGGITAVYDRIVTCLGGGACA